MHGSQRCGSHLGRTGPAPILTPQLVDRLVTLLRAGNYVGVACTAAGVSRRAFNEWLLRGRSDAPGDRPYRELRERVGLARAEGEARNVAIIAQAATENWQAAAWMLERSYPERWARPSQRAKPAEPEPELPVEPADPFAEVDELAQARQRREGPER